MSHSLRLAASTSALALALVCPLSFFSAPYSVAHTSSSACAHPLFSTECTALLHFAHLTTLPLLVRSSLLTNTHALGWCKRQPMPVCPPLLPYQCSSFYQPYYMYAIAWACDNRLAFLCLARNSSASWACSYWPPTAWRESGSGACWSASLGGFGCHCVEAEGRTLLIPGDHAYCFAGRPSFGPCMCPAYLHMPSTADQLADSFSMLLMKRTRRMITPVEPLLVIAEHAVLCVHVTTDCCVHSSPTPGQGRQETGACTCRRLMHWCAAHDHKDAAVSVSSSTPSAGQRAQRPRECRSPAWHSAQCPPTRCGCACPDFCRVSRSIIS